MDNRVIAEKYEILDTLFSNEIQSVYSAKKAGTEGTGNYIVNEFRNADTIYSMKDNFSKEKCSYIRNIVETFYEDFCFYVVCNICPGPDLEYFLSANNLRLTEKMYLTESLLTQLIDIEKLSPFIVYSLCDTDNLFVTGKRNICFNCNFKLTADMISMTGSDVCRRVGEILCAIFSNTVTTDLNYSKDNMPPALFPIISACLEGKYDSIARIYNDFRSLLIYSVFMGSGSVESQIVRNYQKAKTKRKLTPIRRIAMLALLLLVAGGAWYTLKDLGMPASKNGQDEIPNTKPVAAFTASRDQAIPGEMIVFTSQASDPDAGDVINSYLWVVSRDSKPLHNSPSQNMTYIFPEVGKYEIRLVVSDSKGAASEPHVSYITVNPMPISQSPGSGSGGEDYK